MKDKNLPNDYNSLSLEELTNKANKMIEELESQNNLESSVEKYQKLKTTCNPTHQCQSGFFSP